jgi:hypothetical protein
MNSGRQTRITSKIHHKIRIGYHSNSAVLPPHPTYILTQRSIGSFKISMRVMGSSMQWYTNAAIFVLTWIYLAPRRPALAQEICSSSSCLGCLNQNCAWFTIDSDGTLAGECLEGCNAIPDVPCYNSEVNPNESLESICATAEADVTDWTTCSLALDCTSCVSTMQSDNVTPCSWYDETGTCGSGLCTQRGCGSTMCSSTPVPAPSTGEETVPTTGVVTTPTSLCNLNATSCEECLVSMDNETEIPHSCAWSMNRCVDSCVAAAGFPCYSVAAYPDLVSTPKEICLLEQAATMDDDLCGSATTCAKCTELLQTDGTTGCLWFERNDTTVTPYCGAHNSTVSVAQVNADGCDLNGICGVSDCNLINSVAPKAPANTPNAAPRPTSSNTTSGSGSTTAWLKMIFTGLLPMSFLLTNDWYVSV